MNEYGPIEKLPAKVIGKHRKQALLFKRLATLRKDAPLFKDVEELRWWGPTPTFEKLTIKMNAPKLLARATEDAKGVS